MSSAPSSPPRPRLVAGIDEAGLGPLLGPLTFGYSVLRLPPGGRNVWEALESIVSQQPTSDATHIVVADSKRVYSRNPRGRRRLETTALSFLAQRSCGAARAGTDLLRSAPESLRPRAAEIARHPWYAELAPTLPVWTDAGRLELRAEALRRALANEGLGLVEAGVRLTPAGELNRSFARTHNKSSTVWAIVSSILDYFWNEYGLQGLHVIVDRQGGRFRYGRLLESCFPAAKVRVILERPDLADYRIEGEVETDGQARWMRLTFAERAEDRAFTVALGSCLAKYTRELSMEAFNRYFQALQPDLAPTAGYTTDGQRWVRDAARTLERHQIDRDVLIRQR